VALKDYLEPEVAVAVVVTAAIASPPVRKVLRRGLVYGLAGLLSASDKITAAARGVAQTAKQAIDVSGDGNGVATAANVAPPAARPMTG
jgi:hypothetical protein